MGTTMDDNVGVERIGKVDCGEGMEAEERLVSRHYLSISAFQLHQKMAYANDTAIKNVHYKQQ
jgi:hypothetical protein